MSHEMFVYRVHIGSIGRAVRGDYWINIDRLAERKREPTGNLLPVPVNSPSWRCQSTVPGNQNRSAGRPEVQGSVQEASPLSPFNPGLVSLA